MEPRLDGRTAHLADWPCIHAGFAHEGDSEAISAARRFAAGFLARVQGEHGVPVPVETVETAQLVVSELVTNTCKYAPGPGLLDLEVDVDTATLLVSVWDTSSTLLWPARPSRGGSASTVWRSSSRCARATRCSASRWASASRSASPWSPGSAEARHSPAPTAIG